MLINLFYEINRPSLTKEIRETGMLRVFKCFSKIYKRDER